MLPPGLAPERLTPVDGQATWSLMTSSISGGACSGLDIPPLGDQKHLVPERLMLA
jgi:hypothetical protein